MFPLTPIQIAVFLFLIVTFFVSWRSSRGIKTMRDYAMANYKLGGGVLVMTLSATLIEFNDIEIKAPYTRGLLSLLPSVCLTLMTILLGWGVLPKIIHFKNHYTVSDIMRSLHGPRGELVTTILASVFSVGVILSQLLGIGTMTACFFPLPETATAAEREYIKTLFIVGIGLCIVLYTSLGGMRSVAATDVLQFIVVTVGTMCFALSIFSQTEGLPAVIQTVYERDNKYLFFGHYPDFINRYRDAFLWSIWPTFFLSPPVIQRVLMTRSKPKVQQMFVSHSLFYFAFRFLLLLVGLALFVIHPNEEPKSMVMSKIIGACSSTLGQVGLVLVILAAVMSSIDSYLNALAILWVHNVIKPYFGTESRFFSRDVFMTRLCSFVIGTGCIVLSIVFLEIDHPLAFLGRGVMVLSVLCVPFFAGVMGLKGSNRAFWVNLGVFFVIFTLLVVFEDVWEKLFPGLFAKIKVYRGLKTNLSFHKQRWYWLVSILLSAVSFFVTHYLHYGGFMVIDRERHLWKVNRRYRLRMPKLSWLKNPVVWAQEQVAQYGEMAYLFALFFYISFMGLHLSLASEKKAPLLAIFAFRVVGLLLATLFLLKSIWPKKWQGYFAPFYLGTLGYCIPFIGTLTALADLNSTMTLPLFVAELFWLHILVGWRNFLGMQTLGSVLALLVYRLLYDNEAWQALSLKGTVAVIMGYAVALCFLFLRRQQKHMKRRITQLNQEDAQHVDALNNYANIQKQLLSSFDANSSMMDVVREVSENLAAGVGDSAIELMRLKDAIVHLQQMAIKSAEYLPIHPEEISLRDLLNKAFRELQAQGVAPDQYVQLELKTVQTKLVGDTAYLVSLIVTTIKEQLRHEQAEEKYGSPTLIFTIADNHLDYGTGKTYPALLFSFAYPGAEKNNLPEVHALKQSLSPATKTLWELRNRQIVKAHYGVFVQESTTAHNYVVPRNVAQVRPKIERFSDESLEADTQLDGSEDQAFLEAVAKKTAWDQVRIQRALQVAKHYHRHQKRKSGEPFYLHPLAVATILLPYAKDEEMVIAALLHDAVEDTAYTYHQLAAMFGRKVARLVDDVTHLYSSHARKMKLSKKENLKQLLDKEDHAAQWVKLCDRVHNMRTIAGHSSPQRQREIAQETQDFFVPLAEMLQASVLAEELKKSVVSVLSS